MLPSVLEALAELKLPSDAGVHLGRLAIPLRLRRTWPRANDHLLLEYEAQDGTLVPGQWHRSRAMAERAVAGLSNRTTAVVTPTLWCEPPDAAGFVVLQQHGADRRLCGLAPLLEQLGAQLLVHQPERRAVVRLPAHDGTVFAKVVRPGRARGLAAAGEAARVVAAGVFDTPRLLGVDEEAGVVRWSALTGVSLYDLTGGAALERGARTAGVALRALHEATVPTEAQVHGPEAESRCWSDGSDTPLRMCQMPGPSWRRSSLVRARH